MHGSRGPPPHPNPRSLYTHVHTLRPRSLLACVILKFYVDFVHSLSPNQPTLILTLKEPILYRL